MIMKKIILFYTAIMILSFFSSVNAKYNKLAYEFSFDSIDDGEIKLKDYENKILGAEENILSLENKLFNELQSKMSNHINSLQMVSSDISKLDVICGFSCLSLKYNFSKPKLNSSSKLKIIEGRHPVIERQLPAENPYIPNDIYLDNKDQQISLY